MIWGHKAPAPNKGSPDMSESRDIIKAALAARTPASARAVQDMIEAAIGSRHERPLGDRWNNLGLLATAGSFDHKALEPVTNMQDAVLERLAAGRYGAEADVPLATPLAAAQELTAGEDYKTTGKRARVELHRASTGESADKKRITIVYRDEGCGLAPSQVPNTIFALGSSHKTERSWQQGAFGLGGASTYRNAEFVVLVSRRAPEMNPAEDLLTVAVVERVAQGKITCAQYLTTTPWDDGVNPNALPFSAPASEYPEFEHGTHLALISYGVEGFHRARFGDERSFDTVANTRLFQPVIPVSLVNAFNESRASRTEYLRGLAQRLDANPDNDRLTGEDRLPFTLEGATYQLPVRFWLFGARGQEGERRKFVAHNHAVNFTSNGQIHHHWTPAEFRDRTKLNRLHERLFVIVETDEMPIAVRTNLFTADRSTIVKGETALRLETEVAAFIDGWDELKTINDDLVRAAVTRGTTGQSALDIANQISRALAVKGFALGGGSGTRGGGRERATPKPRELHLDPTALTGPAHLEMMPDSTRSVYLALDAVDGFVPDHAAIIVISTHPELGTTEMTVGQLRGGRLRLSVAVPLGAALGDYAIKVRLGDWLTSTGALGRALEHTIELGVVESLTDKPTGTGPGTNPGRSGGDKKGKSGGGEAPTEGGAVAVIWTNPDESPFDDWNNATPGEIEMVAAETLASNETYAALAALGNTLVPTVYLNDTYAQLKGYVSVRARDLASDAGVDKIKSRYAVGLGLGLLYLHFEAEKARNAQVARGEQPATNDPEADLRSRQAVARSVLAIMPQFDSLADASGIQDL